MPKRRYFPQLERERWRLRWSQREMARFLGMSHGTYARWMDRGVPRMGCAVRMCELALAELERRPTPTFDQAMDQAAADQGDQVHGDPFDEGLVREEDGAPARP